ncbi:sigma 54-interacting transcriptional regulator [uncultured Roseobacter sp.]|uniref:sigma-54-dependent Fis family transcriptional regulator n=1 Tax=uncultured Roseobacter sp. TaxID=114847 RepID=UPI0026278D47|nr:sigma 54-interacting transcriptional regulator [uncultured Roseobacter sp.]
MGEPAQGECFEDIIKASWERCELKHGLVRTTAKPVLRLQASEVTPRLDELLERSGGELEIFGELSRLGMDSGHCLVITDADGIVVRFESPSSTREAFETNGIGLGSCWDERVAGTNGVSIAMGAGDAVTVRGSQHYHNSLTPFACTAVPMLNADNETIGAVSLSAFDRGSPTDYLIAKKLLLSAVGKIQSKLFEDKYDRHTIVTVAAAGSGDLLRQNGLVAIDEKGVILGCTARAHELAGIHIETDLRGRQFDGVFGAVSEAAMSVPRRVQSVTADQQPGLSFTVRGPHEVSGAIPGWRPELVKQPVGNLRVQMGPTLDDLSCGSRAMATNCERIQTHIGRATPILIEGESGTGKSALTAAVGRSLGFGEEQIVTLDCASMWDAQDSRELVKNFFGQARVIQALGCEEQGTTVLVLDNVSELPSFAQAGLRTLLDELERDIVLWDRQHVEPGLRIVALSRNSLSDVVEQGRFREDLYYLLAGTVIELPPLREREGLPELALHVGSQIAGAEIQITQEAQEMLATYDWPGNVRELRNVLQQALLEGTGTRISPVELEPFQSRIAKRLPRTQCANDEFRRPIRPAYDERSMLLDALNSTHWNVSKAARVLGIGRATLNRKIKQHGIARPN